MIHSLLDWSAEAFPSVQRWRKAFPEPLNVLTTHRLLYVLLLESFWAQACGSALIREEQRRERASRVALTPRRARGSVASPTGRLSPKCRNKPRSHFLHGLHGAAHVALCLSCSASPGSPTAFLCTPASPCWWDADNPLQPPYRCPPHASTPFLWRNMMLLGRKSGKYKKIKYRLMRRMDFSDLLLSGIHIMMVSLFPLWLL